MAQQRARYLAEQLPREGIRITRAEGSFVWDERRRKYIDFIMGWCVGNLGWNVAEIDDAIARARHPSYVYPHYDYRGWHVLAEVLAELAPGELKRSYRATGGSEAVDIALQIAMVATGRSKFVSIEDSYHGNTLGTLSVGGSGNREQFPRLLSGCKKIAPPLNATKLDRIQALLKNRDVAAFIIEPISINLGVLVPDTDFMIGLRRLCSRYGTLLIADEVASGFGRTGNMFAIEHFDIDADIMTLGKALSGGHGGIGATIVTERVHRKVRGKYAAYSTYGWHPLALDATIANLRYWKKYSHDLLFNCVTIGAFIERRLREMLQDTSVVHARGLAICVELESEKYAEKIVQRCRKAGLLITASGEYLHILPAVNVEREVAERAMDILEGLL